MKNLLYSLSIIIFLAALGCKDKDVDVFGDLCNFRTDTVDIVISPYSSIQNSQNGFLRLRSANATSDTAIYYMVPNTCATLIRGTNELKESDLTFSYLEIRTATDTIQAGGKAEVLSLFKDSRKGLKRLEVY
jgi:hypothetical protein